MRESMASTLLGRVSGADRAAPDFVKALSGWFEP